MKIFPVFLDGPLAGKEVEVESGPSYRYYYDHFDIHFGSYVEYSITQIGFHFGGQACVIDIATTYDTPDTRDVITHVLSDYARKAIRVQPGG